MPRTGRARPVPPVDTRTSPPVHVLVVAYGDPEGLESCLASLGGAYPVLVVDNSSNPATRAVAERAGATYVDSGENVGFASAVNRGLSLLPLPEADVLLLNPDALVEPSTVERLRAELASAPDLCCVAPAQRRPGSERDAQVCWPWPSPAVAWAEALGLGRFRRQWGFVIASVLLVRGTTLAQTGGLDEAFFLYTEETDWERRATELGWRIGYCSDVRALHEGAGTQSDPVKREIRFQNGMELYLRKWYGTLGWRSFQAAKALTTARRALVARGEKRHAALRLLRLYLRGPSRTALRLGVVPPRTTKIPLVGGAGATTPATSEAPPESPRAPGAS